MNTTDKRTTIRFTDTEWEIITNDLTKTSGTIPRLMKRVYFKPEYRPKLIMSSEEAQKQLAELKRWGNNLNQLTKRVNAGLRYGFMHEIRDLAEFLAKNLHFLEKQYGDN